MFTLKQLAVFDAVARLGKVSEAASELSMTQPAASMALQQLEAAIDAKLFLRTNRRLTLSEQGRSLQPLARSMLLGAEEIRSAAKATMPEEQLRIGASPTVGDYLLKGVFAEFMARHPGVRLSVAVLPAFDVISRVDEMAVDIGLIEFVSVRPTLDVVRWRTESLVVFCSPKHPLAARKGRITTAALRGESWCLQHRFADSRRQFMLALLSRLPSAEVVLESDSVQVLVQAVATNIGLGCLPRPCIADELANGQVRELHLRDLELDIPFSIISRKGARRSRSHSAFMEAVLETP
jgi:DNA-binding transcriptional LysR family regulator